MASDITRNLISVLQMGKLRPQQEGELSEPSPSFGKSVGHTSCVLGLGRCRGQSQGTLVAGVFSICRDEGRGEQVRQRMCVRGSLPARWDSSVSHGRLRVPGGGERAAPHRAPPSEIEGVRGPASRAAEPHGFPNFTRNLSAHLPDLLFSQRKDQGPNPRLSALCQLPPPPLRRRTGTGARDTLWP